MDNIQPDPKTNNDDKIEVSNPNPNPQPTPKPAPQASPKPSPITPTLNPEPTPPSPAQPAPVTTPEPEKPLFEPASPPPPAEPQPQPPTENPAPVEPPTPATPPAEPAGQTPSGDSVGTSPLGGAPPKTTSEEPTPIPVSTPASPSNHPPTKSEPQIAVDSEEDKSEEKVANHIDAGQYGMDHSTPPVKQTSNTKGAIIVTGVAILFLGVGFFGGFFGYRYSPKLAKLFSSSADITDSTTEATDSSTPKSTSSSPGDLADWPIYSNTKYLYSIKYPDTWYSQGTGDAQSKTVQFTSYKSDTGTTSTDGFKVEIVFQDSNGKQLKDWVAANNTAAGTTTVTPQEIQVDGKVAFQQTTTAVTKSISTYISRSSQIMIVTYYGPEAKFDEGKALYDKIIGTIKLM